MRSNPRPFRFGIQLSGTRAQGTAARADWIDQAKKAEAFGYDILVMPDHLAGQFAIGPALMAVADATQTLRIGTFVLQNDLRHPTLLAMEAATLDVLSDGRFELGLGAGGSLMLDYEWSGLPLDPPGMRVGKLEESIQVLKGLFTVEPFTFNGQYYTITDLKGYPKPIQQPHPPMLIGGGGRRMLTLAAREADIIGILPTMLPAGGGYKDEESTTEAVAEKVEVIRQAAGDRFSQIELNILTQAIIITDDRQAGMERLRTERGLPPDDWLGTPYVYLGTAGQIADELRACRERLGISYFVVFSDYMVAFAPVVAELAGS